MPVVTPQNGQQRADVTEARHEAIYAPSVHHRVIYALSVHHRVICALSVHHRVICALLLLLRPPSAPPRCRPHNIGEAQIGSGAAAIRRRSARGSAGTA